MFCDADDVLQNVVILSAMLHEISTLENMDQLSLIINEIIQTFKHFNEYEKEADQLFEEKRQKQLKKEV